MSVIVGLSAGHHVLIGGDTRIVRISDYMVLDKKKKKVYRYCLDDKEYIFGISGSLDDVKIFLDIISKLSFSDEIGNSTRDISKCFQAVIKQTAGGMSVLVGGIDNGASNLFRVTSTEIEVADHNGGFLVLAPEGSVIQDDVLTISKDLKDMTRGELHALGKSISLSVMATDPNKTVNDEFEYEYLSIQSHSV